MEVVSAWPCFITLNAVASSHRSPHALPFPAVSRPSRRLQLRPASLAARCAGNQTLKTCKNCKQQFDPTLNHATPCQFHTAHFGGETKRKFESVYTGGTLNTPNSGKVLQYWHCCGSEDPFDAGCTAAPHSSYDD